MSLYLETAQSIENANQLGGSLKSRIYASKNTKSTLPNIYALASQSIKWSPIIKIVIERSGLLENEKKLNPLLATLLVHDLLLSRKGIAAPQKHPLSVAVTKHKARLQAELTKHRIQLGYASIDLLKEAVETGDGYPNDDTHIKDTHPRWVRINRIKTSINQELKTTFLEFVKATSLNSVLISPKSAKILYVDEHVPNLIALPPFYNVAALEAYSSGKIIIQDKASCFPPCLLEAEGLKGDIIDACAAPGNKTTQLASSLARTKDRHVHAFEKDMSRSKILIKMIKQASADKFVTIHEQTDFLATNPLDEQYQNVKSILLDPSCSGSGIRSRDQETMLQLPNIKEQSSKKRKRQDTESKTVNPKSSPVIIVSMDQESEEVLTKRLNTLSSFQLKILCHAMKFSSVTHIVYSTCSIYPQENEHVVLKALKSDVALDRSWTFIPRSQQVEGMRKWPIRGDSEASMDMIRKLGWHDFIEKAEDMTDSCIRCEKDNQAGTIGFFVAGFQRDESSPQRERQQETEDSDEVEWNGFSDSDNL